MATACARDLHAHPYFSKVAPFPPQAGEEVGRTLADHRRDRAGRDRELRASAVAASGHPHAIGQRRAAAGGARRRSARLPAACARATARSARRRQECGPAVATMRLRSWHRAGSATSCGAGEGTRVEHHPGRGATPGRGRSRWTGGTGRSAAPRSCSSSWSFTFAFNFVTLQVGGGDPASLAADDRARRPARGSGSATQERVQGHLNAMAVRLGELQAQMLRLDGLGERLARSRRPEAAGAAVAAARRGARPRRRRVVVDAVAQSVGRRVRRRWSTSSRAQVDVRTDQLVVLEALLVHDSANRKFLPTL